MTKYVSIGTYWVGSLCAALALFARGLDVLGKNFLDFDTRGGGIGYHSLMDGTLFFYAISIATTVYSAYHAPKTEPSTSHQAEQVRS